MEQASLGEGCGTASMPADWSYRAAGGDRDHVWTYTAHRLLPTRFSFFCLTGVRKERKKEGREERMKKEGKKEGRKERRKERKKEERKKERRSPSAERAWPTDLPVAV